VHRVYLVLLVLIVRYLVLRDRKASREILARQVQPVRYLDLLDLLAPIVPSLVLKDRLVQQALRVRKVILVQPVLLARKVRREIRATLVHKVLLVLERLAR
jgi:hypothetical protein